MGEGMSLYRSLARPILFALPPEAAHRVARGLLGLPLPWGRLGGADHNASLQVSLAGIRLANPLSDPEWTRLTHDIVARNPGDDQSVYFQITRGVAKRAHEFPQNVNPTVFMMSSPLITPPPEQVESGVACITATDFRWLKCDVKSTSLLGNCLLRQLAVDAGAVETILFRDGKLTEASASNVFIVRRGVIFSPPKSNLILAGITYDVIAELARADNLPLEFKSIGEDEVRSADEIWVTSSSKEVFPIVSLDGKQVGDGKPGPVFRRMYRLYQEFKQKVMRSGKREAVSAA